MGLSFFKRCLQTIGQVLSGIRKTCFAAVYLGWTRVVFVFWRLWGFVVTLWLARRLVVMCFWSSQPESRRSFGTLIAFIKFWILFCGACWRGTRPWAAALVTSSGVDNLVFPLVGGDTLTVYPFSWLGAVQLHQFLAKNTYFLKWETVQKYYPQSLETLNRELPFYLQNELVRTEGFFNANVQITHDLLRHLDPLLFREFKAYTLELVEQDPFIVFHLFLQTPLQEALVERFLVKTVPFLLSSFSTVTFLDALRVAPAPSSTATPLAEDPGFLFRALGAEGDLFYCLFVERPLVMVHWYLTGNRMALLGDLPFYGFWAYPAHLGISSTLFWGGVVFGAGITFFLVSSFDFMPRELEAFMLTSSYQGLSVTQRILFHICRVSGVARFLQSYFNIPLSEGFAIVFSSSRLRFRQTFISRPVIAEYFTVQSLEVGLFILLCLFWGYLRGPRYSRFEFFRVVRRFRRFRSESRIVSVMPYRQPVSPVLALAESREGRLWRVGFSPIRRLDDFPLIWRSRLARSYWVPYSARKLLQTPRRLERFFIQQLGEMRLQQTTERERLTPFFRQFQQEFRARDLVGTLDGTHLDNDRELLPFEFEDLSLEDETELDTRPSFYGGYLRGGTDERLDLLALVDPTDTLLFWHQMQLDDSGNLLAGLHQLLFDTRLLGSGADCLDYYADGVVTGLQAVAKQGRWVSNLVAPVPGWLIFSSFQAKKGLGVFDRFLAQRTFDHLSLAVTLPETVGARPDLVSVSETESWVNYYFRAHYPKVILANRLYHQRWTVLNELLAQVFVNRITQQRSRSWMGQRGFRPQKFFRFFVFYHKQLEFNFGLTGLGFPITVLQRLSSFATVSRTWTSPGSRTAVPLVVQPRSFTRFVTSSWRRKPHPWRLHIAEPAMLLTRFGAPVYDEPHNVRQLTFRVGSPTRAWSRQKTIWRLSDALVHQQVGWFPDESQRARQQGAPYAYLFGRGRPLRPVRVDGDQDKLEERLESEGEVADHGREALDDKVFDLLNLRETSQWRGYLQKYGLTRQSAQETDLLEARYDLFDEDVQWSLDWFFAPWRLDKNKGVGGRVKYFPEAVQRGLRRVGIGGTSRFAKRHLLDQQEFFMALAQRQETIGQRWAPRDFFRGNLWGVPDATVDELDKRVGQRRRRYGRLLIDNPTSGRWFADSDTVQRRVAGVSQFVEPALQKAGLPGFRERLPSFGFALRMRHGRPMARDVGKGVKQKRLLRLRRVGVRRFWLGFRSKVLFQSTPRPRTLKGSLLGIRRFVGQQRVLRAFKQVVGGWLGEKGGLSPRRGLGTRRRRHVFVNSAFSLYARQRLASFRRRREQRRLVFLRGVLRKENKIAKRLRAHPFFRSPRVSVSYLKRLEHRVTQKMNPGLYRQYGAIRRRVRSFQSLPFYKANRLLLRRWRPQFKSRPGRGWSFRLVLSRHGIHRFCGPGFLSAEALGGGFKGFVEKRHLLGPPLVPESERGVSQFGLVGGPPRPPRRFLAQVWTAMPIPRSCFGGQRRLLMFYAGRFSVASSFSVTKRRCAKVLDNEPAGLGALYYSFGRSRGVHHFKIIPPVILSTRQTPIRWNDVALATRFSGRHFFAEIVRTVGAKPLPRAVLPATVATEFTLKPAVAHKLWARSALSRVLATHDDEPNTAVGLFDSGFFGQSFDDRLWHLFPYRLSKDRNRFPAFRFAPQEYQLVEYLHKDWYELFDDFCQDWELLQQVARGRASDYIDTSFLMASRGFDPHFKLLKTAAASTVAVLAETHAHQFHVASLFPSLVRPWRSSFRVRSYLQLVPLVSASSRHRFQLRRYRHGVGFRVRRGLYSLYSVLTSTLALSAFRFGRVYAGKWRTRSAFRFRRSWFARRKQVLFRGPLEVYQNTMGLWHVRRYRQHRLMLHVRASRRTRRSLFVRRVPLAGESVLTMALRQGWNFRFRYQRKQSGPVGLHRRRRQARVRRHLQLRRRLVQHPLHELGQRRQRFLNYSSTRTRVPSLFRSSLFARTRYWVLLEQDRLLAQRLMFFRRAQIRKLYIPATFLAASAEGDEARSAYHERFFSEGLYKIPDVTKQRHLFVQLNRRYRMRWLRNRALRALQKTPLVGFGESGKTQIGGSAWLRPYSFKFVSAHELPVPAARRLVLSVHNFSEYMTPKWRDLLGLVDGYRYFDYTFGVSGSGGLSDQAVWLRQNGFKVDTDLVFETGTQHREFEARVFSHYLRRAREWDIVPFTVDPVLMPDRYRLTWLQRSLSRMLGAPLVDRNFDEEEGNVALAWLVFYEQFISNAVVRSNFLRFLRWHRLNRQWVLNGRRVGNNRRITFTDSRLRRFYFLHTPRYGAGFRHFLGYHATSWADGVRRGPGVLTRAISLYQDLSKREDLEVLDRLVIPERKYYAFWSNIQRLSNYLRLGTAFKFFSFRYYQPFNTEQKWSRQTLRHQLAINLFEYQKFRNRVHGYYRQRPETVFGGTSSWLTRSLWPNAERLLFDSPLFQGELVGESWRHSGAPRRSLRRQATRSDVVEAFSMDATMLELVRGQSAVRSSYLNRFSTRYSLRFEDGPLLSASAFLAKRARVQNHRVVKRRLKRLGDLTGTLSGVTGGVYRSALGLGFGGVGSVPYYLLPYRRSRRRRLVTVTSRKRTSAFLRRGFSVGGVRVVVTPQVASRFRFVRRLSPGFRRPRAGLYGMRRSYRQWHRLQRRRRQGRRVRQYARSWRAERRRLGRLGVLGRGLPMYRRYLWRTRSWVRQWGRRRFKRQRRLPRLSIRFSGSSQLGFQRKASGLGRRWNTKVVLHKHFRSNRRVPPRRRFSRRGVTSRLRRQWHLSATGRRFRWSGSVVIKRLVLLLMLQKRFLRLRRDRPWRLRFFTSSRRRLVRALGRHLRFFRQTTRRTIQTGLPGAGFLGPRRSQGAWLAPMESRISLFFEHPPTRPVLRGRGLSPFPQKGSLRVGALALGIHQQRVLVRQFRALRRRRRRRPRRAMFWARLRFMCIKRPLARLLIPFYSAKFRFVLYVMPGLRASRRGLAGGFSGFTRRHRQAVARQKRLLQKHYRFRSRQPKLFLARVDGKRIFQPPRRQWRNMAGWLSRAMVREDRYNRFRVGRFLPTHWARRVVRLQLLSGPVRLIRMLSWMRLVNRAVKSRYRFRAGFRGFAKKTLFGVGLVPHFRSPRVVWQRHVAHAIRLKRLEEANQWRAVFLHQKRRRRWLGALKTVTRKAPRRGVPTATQHRFLLTSAVYVSKTDGATRLRSGGLFRVHPNTQEVLQLRLRRVRRREVLQNFFTRARQAAALTTVSRSGVFRMYRGLQRAVTRLGVGRRRASKRLRFFSRQSRQRLRRQRRVDIKKFYQARRYPGVSSSPWRRRGWRSGVFRHMRQGRLRRFVFKRIPRPRLVRLVRLTRATRLVLFRRFLRNRGSIGGERRRWFLNHPMFFFRSRFRTQFWGGGPQATFSPGRPILKRRKRLAGMFPARSWFRRRPRRRWHKGFLLRVRKPATFYWWVRRRFFRRQLRAQYRSLRRRYAFLPGDAVVSWSQGGHGLPYYIVNLPYFLTYSQGNRPRGMWAARRRFRHKWRRLRRRLKARFLVRGKVKRTRRYFWVYRRRRRRATLFQSSETSGTIDWRRRRLSASLVRDTVYLRGLQNLSTPRAGYQGEKSGRFGENFGSVLVGLDVFRAPEQAVNVGLLSPTASIRSWVDIYSPRQQQLLRVMHAANNVPFGWLSALRQGDGTTRFSSTRWSPFFDMFEILGGRSSQVFLWVVSGSVLGQTLLSKELAVGHFLSHTFGLVLGTPHFDLAYGLAYWATAWWDVVKLSFSSSRPSLVVLPDAGLEEPALLRQYIRRYEFEDARARWMSTIERGLGLVGETGRGGFSRSSRPVLPVSAEGFEVMEDRFWSKPRYHFPLTEELFGGQTLVGGGELAESRFGTRFDGPSLVDVVNFGHWSGLFPVTPERAWWDSFFRFSGRRSPRVFVTSPVRVVVAGRPDWTTYLWLQQWNGALFGSASIGRRPQAALSVPPLREVRISVVPDLAVVPVRLVSGALSESSLNEWYANHPWMVDIDRPGYIAPSSAPGDQGALSYHIPLNAESPRPSQPQPPRFTIRPFWALQKAAGDNEQFSVSSGSSGFDSYINDKDRGSESDGWSGQGSIHSSDFGSDEERDPSLVLFKLKPTFNHPIDMSTFMVRPPGGVSPRVPSVSSESVSSATSSRRVSRAVGRPGRVRVRWCRILHVVSIVSGSHRVLRVFYVPVPLRAGTVAQRLAESRPGRRDRLALVGHDVGSAPLRSPPESSPVVGPRERASSPITAVLEQSPPPPAEPVGAGAPRSRFGSMLAMRQAFRVGRRPEMAPESEILVQGIPTSISVSSTWLSASPPAEPAQPSVPVEFNPRSEEAFGQLVGWLKQSSRPAAGGSEVRPVEPMSPPPERVAPRTGQAPGAPVRPVRRGLTAGVEQNVRMAPRRLPADSSQVAGPMASSGPSREEVLKPVDPVRHRLEQISIKQHGEQAISVPLPRVHSVGSPPPSALSRGAGPAAPALAETPLVLPSGGSETLQERSAGAHLGVRRQFFGEVLHQFSRPLQSSGFFLPVRKTFVIQRPALPLAETSTTSSSSFPLVRLRKPRVPLVPPSLPTIPEVDESVSSREMRLKDFKDITVLHAAVAKLTNNELVARLAKAFSWPPEYTYADVFRRGYRVVGHPGTVLWCRVLHVVSIGSGSRRVLHVLYILFPLPESRPGRRARPARVGHDVGSAPLRSPPESSPVVGPRERASSPITAVLEQSPPPPAEPVVLQESAVVTSKREEAFGKLGGWLEEQQTPVRSSSTSGFFLPAREPSVRNRPAVPLVEMKEEEELSPLSEDELSPPSSPEAYPDWFYVHVPPERPTGHVHKNPSLAPAPFTFLAPLLFSTKSFEAILVEELISPFEKELLVSHRLLSEAAVTYHDWRDVLLLARQAADLKTRSRYCFLADLLEVGILVNQLSQFSVYVQDYYYFNMQPAPLGSAEARLKPAWSLVLKCRAAQQHSLRGTPPAAVELLHTQRLAAIAENRRRIAILDAGEFAEDFLDMAATGATEQQAKYMFPVYFGGAGTKGFYIRQCLTSELELVVRACIRQEFVRCTTLYGQTGLSLAAWEYMMYFLLFRSKGTWLPDWALVAPGEPNDLLKGAASEYRLMPIPPRAIVYVLEHIWDPLPVREQESSQVWPWPVEDDGEPTRSSMTPLGLDAWYEGLSPEEQEVEEPKVRRMLRAQARERKAFRRLRKEEIARGPVTVTTTSTSPYPSLAPSPAVSRGRPEAPRPSQPQPVSTPIPSSQLPLLEPRVVTPMTAVSSWYTGWNDPEDEDADDAQRSVHTARGPVTVTTTSTSPYPSLAPSPAVSRGRPEAPRPSQPQPVSTPIPSSQLPLLEPRVVTPMTAVSSWYTGWNDPEDEDADDAEASNDANDDVPWWDMEEEPPK